MTAYALCVKGWTDMRPDSRENLIQNLRDAGCCEKMICDFMGYFDEEDIDRQIALLELHRDDLLNNVHSEERKISCLDYLLYQIRKTSA